MKTTPAIFKTLQGATTTRAWTGQDILTENTLHVLEVDGDNIFVQKERWQAATECMCKKWQLGVWCGPVGQTGMFPQV